MSKKIHLDSFEQVIEVSFESLSPVPNMAAEMQIIKDAAIAHAYSNSHKATKALILDIKES